MATRKGLQRIDVWVSLVAVVVTAAAVANLLMNRDSAAAHYLVYSAWVGWALVPPAWFLIEWSLYDKAEQEDHDYVRLKYNHELASKFWVAGVGVLSALLIALHEHALPPGG